MKKFFLRVSYKSQGLEKAKSDLLQGKHRHDILENAIRILELDPIDDTVGFGGVPNILGEMELDAAFMDGDSRNFAGIAGIKNFLPVRVARYLMEKKLHTLLIGTGAEMFANECGLIPEPTLSQKQRQQWEKSIKPYLESHKEAPLIEIVKLLVDAAPDGKNFDTTIMIVNDANGISGAASTSGWDYKYPGRVGDTPLAGAGLYVDSRWGGCACTGTGEMATRSGAARLAVAHLQSGKSPEYATKAVIEDLRNLQGGVQRAIVVHTIDRNGNVFVATINCQEPIYYHYWHEDLGEIECRAAELQVT